MGCGCRCGELSVVGLSVTTLGLGLHSVSAGTFVKGPGLGQGSGLGSQLGRNRHRSGGGVGVGIHTLTGGSLSDSEDSEEDDDDGLEMLDMGEPDESLELAHEDKEGSPHGSTRRSPSTHTRKQYLHHLHTKHNTGGLISPTPMSANILNELGSQGANKSPSPLLPLRSSSSHRRTSHNHDGMRMSRHSTRGDSTGSFVMELGGDGRLPSA